MPLNQHLKINFNLDFADLYKDEGLKKLDKIFTEFFVKENAGLCAKFYDSYNPNTQDLLAAALILEKFLVKLFDVEKENKKLKESHQKLNQIYLVRREFVQREIAKKFSDCENINGFEILQKLGLENLEITDLEIELSKQILAKNNLEDLINYTRYALYSKEGRKFHKNGALFILPKRTDLQNLINLEIDVRKRNNFNLTDSGYSLNRVQGEANYCIFCHNQNKDSCRKGLCDAKTGEIKIDDLGMKLDGCPLDEKISEMNLLKSQAFSIAALAVACLDNPMIAGTGHRICNDCMKSCIYQKQEPVDIPQIETRVLKDVLQLSYGFEIYSLLTRWNPLALQKTPKQKTGKKILVCGLGPAGYTLSHYLLNSGHEVVAIDGLKIEPLNPEISGINYDKTRCDFKPIKYLDEIYENLQNRHISGFGGVAEYGITVRWDKNFLKIIRLLLERRENFSMFGGIRFGSSITDEIAFNQYGFDHVALCLGAGRPNIIDIKNNFSKGIRSSSDFLMSLQLTGAFRENLFTNLQVRMPAIVIGGGLTAVDTACEVKAYYQIQIKKFAHKVEILGKEKVFSILNDEEKLIAEEFFNHAEKLKAGIDDFLDVKILYRKKIQDSPAYRLNHQELNKAFEEEIKFVENAIPLEAEIDEFYHIKSLKTNIGNFACRSLFVAAGTTPNISAKLEDNLDLEIAGKYFKKINGFEFITKINENSKKAVSFFGDLHPNFEGNVVKAMASAKAGYQEINRVLEGINSSESEFNFLKDFQVKIAQINRLSPHVVEIFIKAPLFAKHTLPGQIFRLHNYHNFAKIIDSQIMAMEGVTVTALDVDKKEGIISGIVLEFGGSTSLIQNFKEGEPCIFMGPSGKPTDISNNETVMLIGGGRGNQPLTILAEAFKSNDCKVLFFAGYRHQDYIVRLNRMQNASDELIISIEDEEAKNGYFQGSVVESIENYFAKNSELKIDRIFALGNNYLMEKIAKLRHEIPALQAAKYSITSLNAPMQCMMKGVCSQCLQKRKNEKGEDEYFYSCSDQDQNSDFVDFRHLHNRCEQNSLSEKLTKMWISYLNNKS